MTFSFSFGGLKTEIVEKVREEFKKIGERLQWAEHVIEAKFAAIKASLHATAGDSATLSVSGSRHDTGGSMSVNISAYTATPVVQVAAEVAQAPAAAEPAVSEGPTGTEVAVEQPQA